MNALLSWCFFANERFYLLELCDQFEISINKPQPSSPFAQMLLKGLSLLVLVPWLGFPAPRSLVQTEVPELKCFESFLIMKKIPFLDNPISLKNHPL